MANTDELEAFVEDTVLNQNSAKSLLLVQAILALSKLENSLVAGGPSAWTPRHKTLAALARRIDGLPSAQVRSYGPHVTAIHAHRTHYFVRSDWRCCSATGRREVGSRQTRSGHSSIGRSLVSRCHRRRSSERMRHANWQHRRSTFMPSGGSKTVRDSVVVLYSIPSPLAAPSLRTVPHSAT